MFNYKNGLIMKRNILLLLITFIGYYYSVSAPIRIEQAKTVAVNFMSHNGIQGKTVFTVETEMFNGIPVYHIINFNDGGWALVSAENSVVPVLGYGIEGSFYIDEDTPEALIDLLEGYKEEIFYMSSIDSISNEISEQWEALQLPDMSRTYVPGTRLLNVPGRGEVAWGQAKNNDKGCTPSYNQKCPERDHWWNFFDCDCHRALAGCGAVAMAQIMWYWQFPKSYDWSLMPTELNNSSTTEQGDAVAQLLKDCGDKSNMNYGLCTDLLSGSWTTTNNIESALRKFGYPLARKVVKDDQFDIIQQKWNDLIRMEIDAKRPVFYRGDKSDLSGDKHYFVIDGYDAADFTHFHINWGWTNNNGGQNFWYLNDLTPGDHNFNKNQMAIIGISPSCPYSDDIVDVKYTTVTDDKHEIARRSITLPADGKILTVKENGSLTLQAEQKITLKPGFSVENGGYFKAFLEPTGCSPDCNGLQLLNVEKVIKSNGSAEIAIETRHANSFQFPIILYTYEVVNMGIVWYQFPIFYELGQIQGDGRHVIWETSAELFSLEDALIIGYLEIYNNCGQAVLCEYPINGTPASSMPELPDSITSLTSLYEWLHTFPEYANVDGDSFVFNQEKSVTVSEPDNDIFTIYPNPNNGTFSIKTLQDYLPYNIIIRNDLGQIVYEQKDIKTELTQIDIAAYAHSGFYIIEIYTKQNKMFKKIVIQ